MRKQFFIHLLVFSVIFGSCGDRSKFGTKDTSTTKQLIEVTVSGLIGSGLVIQNNSGDDLSITENKTYTFATKIAKGSTYNVSVKTQASNIKQVCTVSNATGTVGSETVDDITITCGDSNWVQDAYVIKHQILGVVTLLEKVLL